ncbi:PEP-CTERM sorting domain-containing protein [Tundrisphaera lichenicola]|uniref:PEP-CTERM sorting domain-containing protein n=1 Tax=Tundrisphaera lichenicola TaxID=2029860 RepID=UPI003EC0DE7B
MNMLRIHFRTLIIASAIVIGVSWNAQAGLTLTTDGIAQGFSLSTFASGFPTNGIAGPLGIAFLPAGKVMVADGAGNVRVFASDSDGQFAGSAPVGQFYGANNAVALTTLGSSIYMTRQGIGDVVQLNADGTFNQGIVGGIPAATGMIADPFTGHLFVGSVSNGLIYEVDPLAKTTSVFYSSGTDNVDGLSLSVDGKVLYAAENKTGHIIGISTLTGAKVFDSGAIGVGIDGTAVGTGSLSGNIFANFNDGKVIEINLKTLAQTTIATGGSRGDFVTVDPNGTLLLTQTDSIIRLTAPSGGGFAVPEPSSVAMLAVGCLGSLIAVRRRRANA